MRKLSIIYLMTLLFKLVMTSSAYSQDFCGEIQRLEREARSDFSSWSRNTPSLPGAEDCYIRNDSYWCSWNTTRSSARAEFTRLADAIRNCLPGSDFDSLSGQDSLTAYIETRQRIEFYLNLELSDREIVLSVSNRR